MKKLSIFLAVLEAVTAILSVVEIVGEKKEPKQIGCDENVKTNE